jgi:outer membrane protein
MPSTHAFHRRLRLAALFAILLVFGSARAEGNGAETSHAAPAVSRVAFVNSERILHESHLAQQAQQKLKQDFAPREQALHDLATKIQDSTRKLHDDAQVMQESDREALQQQLDDMTRDFQDRQQEFEQDLDARRSAATAAVLDKANLAVQQIARSEGFDAVVQSAAYVNPAIDITDRVIQALDANLPADAK